MATDPNSGHVYVADRASNRVAEFTIWGEFVKAWGWGVDTGSPQLEVCTTASGCQQGIAGDGAGQFRGLTGVAVDPVTGDIYTYEWALAEGVLPKSLRVQKFSPAGAFLFMLGNDVDQGPSHAGNLCTAAFIADGDTCGAGAVGAGTGEFSNDFPGFYIAVGGDQTLYVGDKGRIQVFEPSGDFKSAIPHPEGETDLSTGALTVDPDGNLYFDFEQNLLAESSAKPMIYKYSSGAWDPLTEVGTEDDPADSIPDNPVAGFPLALSADAFGYLHVVAVERIGGEKWEEVLKFTNGGECVLCVRSGTSTFPWTVSGALAGIATQSTACGLTAEADLYIGVRELTVVRAFGPPPDATVCPPPLAAPAISSQYASSVKTEQAAVRAQINPHFWPDTAYYVEYGTGECSAGGCPNKLPLTPEDLDVGTIDKAIVTDPISLPGLDPATTYHFRFVSQSTGGGPVYGVDPDGEGPEEATFAAGEDATFTTHSNALPARTDCPNQAFRVGPAALLPDCRAYELVSPVDKEDGDVGPIGDIAGYPAGLDQSAASGDAISYSSYRAFADPSSAPFTSQYLSRRSASGWSSSSISPPRGPVPILKEGNTLQATFRAFTADLCEAVIMHDTDPILAPGAIEGYANLYRTDLCGSGGYEALTVPSVDPAQEPIAFVPEPQGLSADGGVVVFRVEDKLTPDAVGGSFQLYRSENGALSLVSILPGGSPCADNSSAGTDNSSNGLRTDSVKHAVSEDGLRTYWSCGGTSNARLYLREAGTTESRKVSETVSSTAPARFWQATPDGGKALFAINPTSSTEKLYVYDAQAGKPTLVAGKASGVLGASEDLSRIYLVSREVKDTGATAEKPNLYLYDEGDFTYIATLANSDAAQNTSGPFTPSSTNVSPPRHSAAVSPDGSAVAFTSLAPLTGFDNTDAESGEADAEVFYYSIASGKLSCASCNPTGARPTGRVLETSSKFTAAAMVPLANSELYFPRVLTSDGSKLFFNSFDALVSRDDNGMADVYEFSPAATQAVCEGAGAELYLEAEGGCLSLISTGSDAQDAAFVDASPSGRDVFFTTGQSLVNQDPGLIDLYDAREGGGFAPAPAPPVECEGSSCQSPDGPGPKATLQSLSPLGGGNVKTKPRCPKGKRAVKRKGKTVCVKKHKKHKARDNRRAGR